MQGVRGVFFTFYWDFSLGGDILLHIKRLICFIFINVKTKLEHIKACLPSMTNAQIMIVCRVVYMRVVHSLSKLDFGFWNIILKFEKVNYFKMS